jgi:hypothetical protein
VNTTLALNLNTTTVTSTATLDNNPTNSAEILDHNSTVPIVIELNGNSTSLISLFEPTISMSNSTYNILTNNSTTIKKTSELINVISCSSQIKNTIKVSYLIGASSFFCILGFISGIVFGIFMGKNTHLFIGHLANGGSNHLANDFEMKNMKKSNENKSSCSNENLIKNVNKNPIPV